MRKTRKFILLVIILVVLGVAISSIYYRGRKGVRESGMGSRNLLLNSRFEVVDRSGRPEFWKMGGQAGWSVSTDAPFEGERCMQATKGWSWLSQEVRVKPGKYYLLKAYLKSDIVIPQEVNYENTFLTLECLDWKGKVIKRDYGIVNATSSWELRERWILAPKNAKKIRVKLAKRQGEGSVWFDDVQLISSGLALNGSFEMVGSSGKPELWSEDGQGGWSVTTEDPFEGERCMQATKGWSWLSQDIPVRAKRYYYLRTYVRSDITLPEKTDYHNTFLTLECLDGKDNLIKRDYGIVNATSTWELKERWISAPENTEKIRIKLAKRQGEGSVWFDGIRFAEVPSGLVLNPDFEIVADSDKPEFWSEHRRGGWSVTTQEFYEGEKSMQAAVAWSWLSQDVPVEPKNYYILSVHLKSDIALSDKESYWNAFLILECLDEKGEVIKRNDGIVHASPTWKLKQRLIFAPENTEKIRVKLAKRQGEGSVWFDSIKLEKQTFMGKLTGKVKNRTQDIIYTILGKRKEEIRVDLKNIVLNPNFELLNELHQPEAWIEDSLGGWSVTTKSPYEGERSMQATVGWSWLSQEVPVKPEKYYSLKAYIKSDIVIAQEVNYENTFLTLECLDGEGKVIKRDHGIVNATSSWQLKGVQIYAPSGTEEIRVKLAKRQGEGSVWFDKIELVEISEGLVFNPGFEMLSKVDKPDSWIQDSQGGWHLSTTEPHRGEKCMEATIGWSWLWQDVPAKPKKQYSLKAYVRSDIVIPEKEDFKNTFLTLECLNRAGEVIKRDWGITNATSSWDLREKLISAPEGTEKIRIKLAKRQGEGSVWFDDVELRGSSATWKFLARIGQDKPFFIFYFAVYIILLVSLLRIVLKREPKKQGKERNTKKKE